MAAHSHSASKEAANAIPPFPVTSLPPASPFVPESISGDEPNDVATADEPAARSIDLSNLPRPLFSADPTPPLPLTRPLVPWPHGNGPDAPPIVPPVLPGRPPSQHFGQPHWLDIHKLPSVLPVRPPSQPPALPPAPVFHDRQWLLSMGGVVMVVLGFVLAAGLPLRLARDGADIVTRWRTGVPLLIDHLVIPGAFITLGLGSVFAKRWARHLMLGVATIAFAGLLALFTAQFLFALRDGRLPRDPIHLFWLGLTGLGVLAIPWLVIALYSHRHTRSTCETLNPPCWTDRVPEGAIIICLSCALLARYFAARWFDAPFPFFGRVLEEQQAEFGWLAASVFFLLAAVMHVWRWAAAWSLALIGGTVMGTSFVWTVFAGPPAVIERWWKFPSVSATDAGVLVAALFVLWLVLLASLARHLRRPAHEPR